MRERVEALHGSLSAGPAGRSAWLVRVPHPGGIELIRVLLVDDQPFVRAGLVRILEPEPDLEIVGECADGDEVEAAVAAHAPDVILMDVRMKRMDGAEATRRVRQADDAPAVLILTTFDDDQTVATALAAGAAGFLLKDAPGEDLIRATRTVGRRRRRWLDPAVAGPVLDAYRTTALPRARSTARLAELTERERDVLRADRPRGQQRGDRRRPSSSARAP